MRFTCLAAASMGFVLGLVPGAIAREALNVGDQTPQDYAQVREAIDQIEPYLEGAQCGGWLDESVEGKIARVEGVPGRNHDWNGAILSGMGTRTDANSNGDRNDDLVWPDSARGFVSSCFGDTSTEPRLVWRVKEGGNAEDEDFPEIEQQIIDFPSPFFGDPACRWRLEDGGDTPPIPLPEDGELAYGETVDLLSPGACRDFCVYVNNFVYLDCLDVQTAFVPGDPPTPYFVCNQWGHRYLCSEAPAPTYGLNDLRDAAQLSQWTQLHAQTNQEELCPAHMLEDRPDNAPPPSSILSNSRSCTGEGCRCNGRGCLFTENGRYYWSYFRRYFGSYERDVVQADAGADRAANEAPVACYGSFFEFDPLRHATYYPDRRCVIDIDVSQYPISQTGKGEYGQLSDLPDRDPAAPEHQRNNGEFDEENDLWYQKLSGGFSLLNETVFEDEFDRDLSGVFLNIDRLDSARMRATEQLDEARPLAESNAIRAFDDTGTGRILVTWWQKQQSEMAAILHPPVIRMLLPAGWAFGVDPTDPLFLPGQRNAVSGQEKRGERIEVQISAEEDILGSAIGYIERSLLLDVEEERVPVLVPMGSPTEFRALAEQWCTWYMTQFNQRDCAGAPSDVRGLMLQMEQYADDIDNARLLRAELARYAGRVLELQRSITEPIGQWVKANIDQYQSVLEEQRLARERFAAQWRQVQELFNRFGNETNMPWCMNQRYTSPIYSLLDEWLPSRRLPGAPVSAEGLPNLRAVPAEDVIIDFSTITYMTGSIVLPVLEPVQVRITDLPVPPAGKEYSIEGLPPQLASVERIREHIRQAADNLPEPPANVEQPPVVDMEPLGEEALNEIGATIDAIGRIVMDMNDRYDRFWKSIGPLKPDETDEEALVIRQMKENLECTGWDSDTCQHVEMDLLERFVRIASRPLVMLNEDYDSLGALRSFGGPCMPEDHVCTPMHPESTPPREQWEITGSAEQPVFIDDVRRNIRNETLPRPAGGLSSSAMPVYDVDIGELLPIHDVPSAIDLAPPAGSSSSSVSP